ncbi:hypothetical protein CRUP_033891 [Coryphaenoides rupestris]|nr:hypothetical protein CRUP_033891 [Coryphaenoides rupestris]
MTWYQARQHCQSLYTELASSGLAYVAVLHSSPAYVASPPKSSRLGLLGHHASTITKLYHYVNVKMNWTDAQTYCREHFDNMATVDNPDEVKQLQDSTNEGIYTYVQNQMTWYQARQHCQSLYTELASLSAKLAKEGVTGVKLRWVLKDGQDQQRLLGHHASAITKLFHYVDQMMNWADAQSYCREHFDDLATVDNPEELMQVKASRNGFDYQKDRMWIGLYDDLTKWQWFYGNQEYKRDKHYGNWLPGVPNFTGAKENCTMMTKTGQWEDSACNLLYSAVCINDEGNYNYTQRQMTWYQARQHCQSLHTELASERQKQGSTVWLKISSEADMMDPEVQRQILEQFSAKLAKEGVTGVKFSRVLKDGQDQQSEK